MVWGLATREHSKTNIFSTDVTIETIYNGALQVSNQPHTGPSDETVG